MAIFIALVAFGTPFVIVAAIANFIARVLSRHKLTEEELRRLELDDRNGAPALMLPTLTTEITQRIGRDPEYEIDATIVRMKGLSGF